MKISFFKFYFKHFCQLKGIAFTTNISVFDAKIGARLECILQLMIKSVNRNNSLQ